MAYVTGSDYVRELEAHREEARDSLRRRQHQARQERARLAGIASGVARREAAKERGRPRRKRRCIVSRERHRQLYEARCRKLHILLDARSELGLETSYRLYRSLVARGYSGQAFETTNGQQARALTMYGRPRCTRTVQRHRAILAELGLIGSKPVHRRGSMLLQRDTVRVWLCTTQVRVTLLRKKEEEEPSALLSPPSTTQIEPPTGGRERPPDKPAGNGSDEKATAPLPFFDMAAARRRARARWR